ncbi:hypothetical protein BC936DRAFT_136893 [Jimgerdemannia flammicorona]|uniref:Uncharacterized protein n=1 Tax=Jimgerdemannia flammicorona TaxID=994334 RepID=A0A433CYK0_9FUNG|nr:hypothetical protein BC936DRAFT_136893 [Jimgerdemannia flammicorona]
MQIDMKPKNMNQIHRACTKSQIPVIVLTIKQFSNADHASSLTFWIFSALVSTKTSTQLHGFAVACILSNVHSSPLQGALGTHCEFHDDGHSGGAGRLNSDPVVA